MADKPIGPMLPQLLLQGPLGSWFQIPQLGSPMPPFCKLELSNRRRFMTRMPNLPIMKFPSIFSGSKGI